jgi:hypothetical protein
MPKGMRFVLAALLLGALVAPADASAQPTLRYTGPAASIVRGAPLTFAVETAAAPGTVTVRVAGALETGADGLLTGADGTWLDAPAAPLASGLLGWTVPRSSVLRQRPGTYYWQAFVPGDPAQLVGPVQKLDVTLPAADRGRGRLFPRLGRRGSARFLLSTANLPTTVSRGRFRTLARATAARWGLRAGGRTRLTAGVQDGHDVAGFSPDVPAGVLGLETDFTRGGRVTEQDLALNPAEDWAAGPGYPGLGQIDLESVLLHELGHMAGNKRHRALCTNSPMVVALGAGEWWRGPRDHWFDQCSGAVATAATAASVSGLLEHRVIPVD